MQSSIMLAPSDKLRPTPDITYAEIGPNSPSEILLPRVETKISSDAEQFCRA